MQKLELTWIGKGQEPEIEPRILIHDKNKSYGDENTENMLIHGDNLLALKALEQQYAGKIKCIYIDPPYNTGSAFEHYDDNLEHSIWLSLMKSRLEILRNLLADDGVIFVQIDDVEQAYLKVIMDEIFGRSNFINVVTVKTKIGGVSGSSEGKSLKDATEFINIFAKDKINLLFNDVFTYTEISEYVQKYKNEGKSWKYTSVIKELSDKVLLKDDGDIKYYGYRNFKSVSVSQFARENNISEAEVYSRFSNKIFRTTNAQSSIRQKVIDNTEALGFDIVSIEYIPMKGKNQGTLTEILYKGDKCNMFMLLSDMMDEINGKSYYKEKLTTLWENIQYNNLAKEGQNSFPNGKKPELLIKNILELSTKSGDIVLDSFLGSGTTAAVAHKMGRKWIGIELGEHCYTHCKTRLEKIIDGEDKQGISNDVDWQGGGGFKFYELAPSLLKKDKYDNWIVDQDNYNADMLAAAVTKLNGYFYNPDKEVFWKQGKSTESSYIFTTTQYITAQYLDSLANELGFNERLLVCCPAFDRGLNNSYDNITIKKIPQSILNRCQFGVSDYNMNIVNFEDFEGDEDEI